MHSGRSKATRVTVGRDTNQSFRVCEANLATLKVAIIRIIVSVSVFALRAQSVPQKTGLHARLLQGSQRIQRETRGRLGRWPGFRNVQEGRYKEMSQSESIPTTTAAYQFASADINAMAPSPPSSPPLPSPLLQLRIRLLKENQTQNLPRCLSTTPLHLVPNQ